MSFPIVGRISATLSIRKLYVAAVKPVRAILFGTLPCIVEGLAYLLAVLCDLACLKGQAKDGGCTLSSTLLIPFTRG